jgi:hypothetical protein
MKIGLEKIVLGMVFAGGVFAPSCNVPDRTGEETKDKNVIEIEFDGIRYESRGEPMRNIVHEFDNQQQKKLYEEIITIEFGGVQCSYNSKSVMEFLLGDKSDGRIGTVQIKLLELADREIEGFYQRGNLEAFYNEGAYTAWSELCDEFLEQTYDVCEGRFNMVRVRDWVNTAKFRMDRIRESGRYYPLFGYMKDILKIDECADLDY